MYKDGIFTKAVILLFNESGQMPIVITSSSCVVNCHIELSYTEVKVDHEEMAIYCLLSKGYDMKG